MAYDVADLTSSIRDDLKDPSFNATRILRYLNQAQRKIFNTHLLKICQRSVSGTLTIDEDSFYQQLDHEATIGGALIDPVTSQVAFKLQADNYINSADFFRLYPDSMSLPSGVPSAWTEYGGSIFFNRPVDKPYTFTMRYYRVPSTLTANTPDNIPEVPENYRELLESYALYKAEKYRGNHDVAATWLQEFEDGQETMNMRLNGAQRLVKGSTARVVRPVHL